MNYDDYFCKLQCCYWREFDFAYSRLDVKDKTITIIGNDCGSSALYFLLKGAKKIIGFEKEEKLNQIFKETVCKEFKICDKVEIKGKWKGNEYPDTDILVMDCEGCEKNLDFSKLQKYKQYCIAIHDWTENRFDLMRKLYGSILTFVSDDNREFVFCKL
ncbi:hypothetical protein [Sulfolobus islandicus rod-shaped virus 2]|uniref:Methyltransferase domain-containing protein n=1 Tax=Sulfolobus islandicus rod-shaped virus 2 TaxID=157899 RepID=Q8V9M8_SIRV2|nr:SAM-dependent methyltransferase [Sulfolobus islandicus rod-shaped virus 2]CAC87316.1 hypothetical protein [Sulfolobus islandicus rod-shaped virus 2]